MASGERDTDGAGRLLAGRYRVLEQLGRGGMGVVCRAVDEVLGREVAVKELRTLSDASGAELEGLRQRMQREARAAARVRHPGVVAVHDVTEHEGRPVIVMELVHGPSLDDVLREHGPLEPAEAAAIGAAVLQALAAAHAVGVLHRDVKPGNILLERGAPDAGPGATIGRVVLTDFGIAALDGPDDGATTRLTRSGELVGSLDYLAPERARGEEPGPAADVWALGATLYAAVEGAAPFRRTSTWSTLQAIVVEPLPAPRRAGPLAPALDALMHKDPRQRADARRAERLLAAVAERGGSAPSTTGTLRLGRVEPPPAVNRAPTVTDASEGGPTPRSVPGAPPPAGRPAASDQPGPPVAPVVSDIPRVPPGAAAPPDASVGLFGPYATPPGPGEAVPVATHPGDRDTDRHTVSTGTARSGRRRARAVVAAAVAAVLLAGAGVSYAVLTSGGGGGEPAPVGRASTHGSPPAESADRPDGRGPSAQPEESPPDPSPEDEPPENTAPAPGAGGATEGDGGSGEDGGSGGQEGDAADGGGADGGTGGGSDSGGDVGGSDPGGGVGGGTGGDSGGGEDPTTPPACEPSGDGRFNCEVWRTADTYDADHNKVGQLGAGTNYFYCQVKLEHRETYGEWTNVWWARTDDDSGNTGVFVSDVYLTGGENDAPVPGLPVC